jgi:hypothetical protein
MPLAGIFGNRRSNSLLTLILLFGGAKQAGTPMAITREARALFKRVPKFLVPVSSIFKYPRRRHKALYAPKARNKSRLMMWR